MKLFLIIIISHHKQCNGIEIQLLWSIHIHYNIDLYVQVSMSMSTTFEWLKPFLKIWSLNWCWKSIKKKQIWQARQTHNLLLSFVVFVCESYLYWDSCKCKFREKSTTSCTLLSMTTMSNNKYECLKSSEILSILKKKTISKFLWIAWLLRCFPSSIEVLMYFPWKSINLLGYPS